MNHQLLQRLEKRAVTVKRVSKQVSYLRIVNRLQLRNKLGEYVLNIQFDKGVNLTSYANGGDLYVDIFQESVRRGWKI